MGAPCFREGFCSKTIIPDSEEHPLASSRAVPKAVLRWVRVTAEADKSVPEGDPNATSTVTVLVSLSTPSGLPVEVDFATQDGTATTANNDYDATSGTLTFAPGDAPKTISVTINGDEDIEADQTFSVVLSNATTSPNAAVAFTTDGTTEVTITNDDVNPNLTVPVVLQVSEPSDGATTTVKVRATISPQAWVAKDVVVTYSTANGSASASTDYVAQTGQTVTISGGQTFVDIEIVVKGDATQEGEENFFVNVTNATNANVTVSQTEVKIVEQPTLTIADPAPVNENAGTVSLTVTLNPTSSVQTTVTYSTANATAVSPGDYTARTNTLVTIPAGQSSATIAIPIANDVIDEDNETFTVTLDAGSETGTGTLGAALIGTPNAATVTITDDDDLPTLRIGDASVREEIASGTVSQTITLSPVSGRDVMVNYTTQDGTAKDGVSDADPADYVATSSVATIPAGSTFLTFNVTIVDDAIKEPDEVFNVVLSSPVNATLADASSAITIIDDEVRPEVSIDDVEVVEGANASFTISQDIVAGEDTLVDYDTSDGTATAGSDYTAVSDGTATIPAGSLSTTVVINTTDDSEEEDAETAVVTLSNARSVDPAGVVIKDDTGLLVINDNEPAAKIVTITSEGEAMPGDYYFVVTAGTPTNATGFVTLANVSVYLQKTYGLDEVRSKTATHVMLAQVPTSAPLGIMTHAFATGGLATDTDLLIVNERSNRNFYLFPGTNYTGVGLIPDASSDTFLELLAQTVPNAHPDYVAALKALDPANTKLDRDIVKLSDVIDMVFVYNGFNSFGSYSPSPVRLTNSFRNVGTASIVRAFQGMLIVGRDTLTDPSSTVVPVFDTASHHVSGGGQDDGARLIHGQRCVGTAHAYNASQRLQPIGSAPDGGDPIRYGVRRQRQHQRLQQRDHMGA